MRYYVKCLIFHFFLNYSNASFRCDYTYSKIAKGWFKYYKIPATWQDARLRCTLQLATLASPTSPEMESEMILLMKANSCRRAVYTGIHSILSPGNFRTIEGIPLDNISTPWAKDEPDNHNNNERCVTFSYRGNIADNPCDVPRPYICFRAQQGNEASNQCGTLDSEYRFDSRTNKCYKFHTTARTFARANFACEAEGGHLVIINSATEAKVVKELFAKYPASKIVGQFWRDVAFVGFHDWGEQTDWRTLHGQTLAEAGYAKFSGAEPLNATTGEYCGSVYRTALLNDLWCNNYYAHICEKDPAYPPVCNELDQMPRDPKKLDIMYQVLEDPVED